MLNKKFLMIFLLSTLGFSSASYACVWVEIGDSKLECRTPYRQFFSGDAVRRKAVLNVAFKNAKRKLHEVLNEKDVLALMTESDLMYKAGNTEAIDDMIQEAEKILDVTNKITVGSDRYIKQQSPLSVFEDGTLSLYPSAYMVGFTVPMKKGVTLPFAKVLAKFKETMPNLEVGGGSIFFGAVLVPQFVEFIAKHSPEGDFSDMDGRMVFEDKERNTRVYDVTLMTKAERLRLNDVAIKAFPTADLRVSIKEGGLRKAGGIQPTVAMAWGDSIYTPDHVGEWGVSYSLPTSISRIPFGSSTIRDSALYQGSLLGKTFFTGRVTWGLLRVLDLAGVETAKVSWNSSDNLAGDIENFKTGIESWPLDQIIVNLRWGDFKNRRIQRASKATLTANDITHRARVGVNFGLGLVGSISSSSSIMGLLSDGFSEADRNANGPRLTAEDKAKLAVGQAQSRLTAQSIEETLRSNYVEELLSERTEGEGLTDQEIKALAKEIQRKLVEKIEDSVR